MLADAYFACCFVRNARFTILLDVLRLRLPVGFEGREVFELQDAVGMREAGARDVLVVFGADGQQNAATIKAGSA